MLEKREKNGEMTNDFKTQFSSSGGNHLKPPNDSNRENKMSVNDFHVYRWLGNGAFGRVGEVSFKPEAAKRYKDQNRYAMKIIKKKDV